MDLVEGVPPTPLPLPPAAAATAAACALDTTAWYKKKRLVRNGRAAVCKLDNVS